MKNVFIVIAAMNEEKHIAKVVKNTKKYGKVVVVDDGSDDKTSEIAEKQGAIVLKHVVNLGKGAATKTGCQYAISNGAKIIILLDGDGQHEPKDIPKFIRKLKKVDMVFGIRKGNKSMPMVLKFGNYFINNVTAFLFGIYIPDTQCGFRAFKVKIFKKIRWHSSNYSMESEMVANVGRKKIKFDQVEIETIYGNKYKGTTIIDGIRIVVHSFWWRLTRW